MQILSILPVLVAGHGAHIAGTHDDHAGLQLQEDWVLWVEGTQFGALADQAQLQGATAIRVHAAQASSAAVVQNDCACSP